MNDPNAKKTFHLAITMAGAISAGAYTAGVMDYLLEALDHWTEMKQKAHEFFLKYPSLKDRDWKDFKNTAEYIELQAEGKNMADLEKKAERYNAVPDHDVQIEIMSGASAGGMTAAIASLVLQLENKHHVKFLPDVTDQDTLAELDEIKGNNRLYDSWVNLTSDDMLSVLLSNDDLSFIGKPVSALNSQFIRQVSRRALRIDETDKIIFAPYVSEDFNLFVTLTNLQGYQKSLNINSRGQRADLTNYGDFITYNHSDLVMFSFGENADKGAVHIDFNRQNDDRNQRHIRLLGDAAVATGAFPIGLEYASFRRDPQFINDNFLIKKINPDVENLVAAESTYRTTLVDGGLINNEPFELTDCLLKLRLKAKLKSKMKTDADLKKSHDEYMADFEKNLRERSQKEHSTEDLDFLINEEKERWFETEVRRRQNYTILMIDPFPSEKRPKKDERESDVEKYYPFDLLGVIWQLVATTRSQLLVKTDLFSNARDRNDFSCYLIAPRRRKFQRNEDGSVKIGEDRLPIPVYELDQSGEPLIDQITNRKISKVYDGSAAIACGSLGGFGGFLDKIFREHDFFLGRLNCYSFLRRHFAIKSEGDDKVQNAVTEAYANKKGTDIFQKECGKGYVPIIPDMNLLKEHTLLSTEHKPPSPDDLYYKLRFPRYDMKVFRSAKSKVIGRIWALVDSTMKTRKLGRAARYYIRFGFWRSKHAMFDALAKYIEEQLKAWEIIR